MSTPKTVVVTGGTFGIGRELALFLAERGHRVVAFGLEARQAASTAEGSVTALRAEVAERGLDVLVLEADVTDAAQVAGVTERTLERFGGLDALVNNAAIGPLGTVLDTDEELFDRILDVNLKGPYLCARAVLPHLIRAGGGSIVNIGSGAGWGKPNMAAYSASKGGLSALSTAMAYDFFHDHVRVNMVIPGGGGIASGITHGRLGDDTEQIRRAALGSAAGRPVTGADVAGVVDFLISDAGATISGTFIDVGCFAQQGGPLERKKTA